MSWQDLLGTSTEQVVYPWTGGREVRAGGRTFKIKGALPREHGWHTFDVSGGRTATYSGPAEIFADDLFTQQQIVRGYIIGDRLLADQSGAVFNPAHIPGETVALLEPGLERFARIRAGRWVDGRLIYMGQEFPLGPEDAVTAAFQDRKPSILDIPCVTPALNLAFTFESWNRAETLRLREEASRLAREEEARRALEDMRANLVRQLGDGLGRRAVALVDFEAAAKAALQMSEAELLDWRDSRIAGDAVVQFRYRSRRFECVVNKQTLRIVEAGVCLTDERTGRRDDSLLTLESLPPTIGQAMEQHRLVVFRHVGYDTYEDNYRDDDED